MECVELFLWLRFKHWLGGHEELEAGTPSPCWFVVVISQLLTSYAVFVTNFAGL